MPEIAAYVGGAVCAANRGLVSREPSIANSAASPQAAPIPSDNCLPPLASGSKAVRPLRNAG
jgi:hypothetical protein